MGTELQRRGLDTTLPLWSARALLDSPEAVAAIQTIEVKIRTICWERFFAWMSTGGSRMRFRQTTLTGQATVVRRSMPWDFAILGVFRLIVTRGFCGWAT